MSDELESPLSRAISKARGDIRTDTDMKAVIDFGNKMANAIKESSSITAPEARVRIYPTSCELHADGYHTACAKVTAYVERASPPDVQERARRAEQRISNLLSIDDADIRKRLADVIAAEFGGGDGRST